MRKNFTIDNAVAIESKAFRVDLHNAADFTGINFEVASRKITLLFSCLEEYNTSLLRGHDVIIEFSDVDYFEISANFIRNITTNLEETGYKNPGDADIDWLVSEKASNEYDHLFFRFSNDEYLRIHAKTALCKLVK